MTTFLRNTWYVAARASEAGRKPLLRMILDEHVLMFRRESGDAVAISGVCPHRFAPLDAGTLIGDTIQCAYHGLQFDGDGRCVFNPHDNGTVPAAAHIRKYNLAEKHGLLWIWMGVANLADEDTIPDFSHLTSPDRKTIGGHMIVKANYELLADNLLDPSHAQFLHGSLLNVGTYGDSTLTVSQDDSVVSVKQWLPNGPIPEYQKSYIDGDPDQKVDMWLDFQWRLPSLLLNSTGFTPTGQPRDAGVERIGTHILTPETEFTTHYFYGSSRSYKLDDPAVDEIVSNWHRVGFGEQDGPMLESVQRMMGKTSDLLSLRPVLLSVDAAPMRARRRLAQAIAEEAKSWPLPVSGAAPGLRSTAR